MLGPHDLQSTLIDLSHITDSNLICLDEVGSDSLRFRLWFLEESRIYLSILILFLIVSIILKVSVKVHVLCLDERLMQG